MFDLLRSANDFCKILTKNFTVRIIHRGTFILFDEEQYKLEKSLNGEDVARLFERYDVWNYLYTCYKVLHTTGTQYIINDIAEYLACAKYHIRALKSGR